MEGWAVAGIAIVIVLAVWGGLVQARHMRRNAEWSTDFGRRHGKGAQLLVGALVGGACLLIAVLLPGSGDSARNLLAGVSGVVIMGIFVWRYIGWKRGRT